MDSFIIVNYILSNEHTLVDKSIWRISTSGLIEAMGFGVGLAGALTEAEDGNVRVLSKITVGSKETQRWNLEEKSNGWYTIERNGGYLTCHDEGYLTVQDLRPDLPLPGIYRVSHRWLRKT